MLAKHVPLLVERLLGRIARQLRRPLALTAAAFASLQRQEWPGNVRELKHRLEQAAVFAPGGIIDASALDRDGDRTLDDDIRAIAAVIAHESLERHPGDAHRRYIDRLHRPSLGSVLARTDGNYAEASRLLGINRITSRRWMEGETDGGAQSLDPSG